MLSQSKIELKETIKAECAKSTAISEIARKVGKTVPTVYWHMRSMGIYKSKEQKLGHVPAPERKTTYDRIEEEEMDLSQLPDNVIFQHDKSYSF